MPHAEDGAGYGHQRHHGEVGFGQRGTKAGVLHAHFDGEGFLRVVGQAEEFGGEEA